MPLGDASDAYCDIGVLHGNLDEAAACVGRKKEFLERYNIRDGLENVLSMAEVESIALALLRRGCGVVLFTLGPLGAFAMTNDEPTLRRTLGRIEHGLLPSHVSRRAAFKARRRHRHGRRRRRVPRGRRGVAAEWRRPRPGSKQTGRGAGRGPLARGRVSELAAAAAGGARGAGGLDFAAAPTVARTVYDLVRVRCACVTRPHNLRPTCCVPSNGTTGHRTRPSRKDRPPRSPRPA